ncbi:hypothetical protein WJX77_012212 [Trebouxia sp. C0004]
MPTNRTTKAAGRLARTFGQRAHVYDFTNFRQGPRRFVSLYSWTSLSYARSLSGTNVWCFHFASHFNSSFSRVRGLTWSQIPPCFNPQRSPCLYRSTKSCITALSPYMALC